MDPHPAPVPPRRRPRLATLIGALLLVAAAVVILRPYGPPPLHQAPRQPGSFGDGAPPVGRAAPDFTLPLFSGDMLSLHSLRGKPVLLNFWASWCAPCREEMPLLVHLHKLYGPRGIEFVGVNVMDRAKDARKFVEQYHVDFLLVQASDERLMEAYAIPGLPTTVFIGADGVVVGKVVGGFVGPGGERSLITWLDRLLASVPR
jgi:cytochrome c biogenesis protein CcmG/thiol:disulfide interchange protein DsbE